MSDSHLQNISLPTPFLLKSAGFVSEPWSPDLDVAIGSRDGDSVATGPVRHRDSCVFHCQLACLRSKGTDHALSAVTDEGID